MAGKALGGKAPWLGLGVVEGCGPEQPREDANLQSVVRRHTFAKS